MQTKPLIQCADAKGIMIKLMLCMIAVLSLTMFIPQKVEAGGGCNNCTCSPGDLGRHEWSRDNDYTFACSNNGACEVNCGGHRYDKGPGTDNDWDAGWDWTYDEPLDYYHDYREESCNRVIYHRMRLHYKCSICGQIIGWDIDEEIKWDEHNLQGMEDYRPDAADPCKWVKHGEVWCTVCGGRFKVNEFAF